MKLPNTFQTKHVVRETVRMLQVKIRANVGIIQVNHLLNCHVFLRKCKIFPAKLKC